MTDKQWFDKYTRHMIDTELYAEARASLAEDMLNKLHRELRSIIESYGTITSKARQKECEDECNECIERYLAEWKEKEDKEREVYAGKESDWLERAVKAALGISLVNSLLKRKRALETPFSPADTFDSFVETMAGDIKKSIRTPLLSSRIFGSSTTSVSESLDSAFIRIERNFKTNMQSSVTGLQRNVQYQLLEDKRKLKFVYISMLDDRTCVVCGGYSAAVYEDLSEAPAVPVHYRCRCYYMPVISSSDEVGKETYEEWFERQPDSVKYKILGKTRYAFYKTGITKITSFSSGGRKLTLNELFSGNTDTSKPKHPYNGVWQTEKVTKKASIHIAKERLEYGMKDPLVYGSDKMMAKTLAKYSGKDVWLLPEIHKEKGMVNPDAFFEGKTLEMKHVRSARPKKIGTNAINALSQSENIFLYIEGPFEITTCTEKIKGSIFDARNTALKNGQKFREPNKNGLVLIYTKGVLHRLTWGDIL